MDVDWYIDLAVRATGGLLLITCACLLFGLLKECAGEAFGVVRGHATANSDASKAPNEGTTTKEASRTAHQNLAIGAAQHVIAIATNRNNVSAEHLLFYDFVTAAARVVISNPALAETVGEEMRANNWEGSSKVDSFQQRPRGFDAEAA
jgi:hypothetical protein